MGAQQAAAVCHDIFTTHRIFGDDDRFDSLAPHRVINARGGGLHDPSELPDYRVDLGRGNIAATPHDHGTLAPPKLDKAVIIADRKVAGTKRSVCQHFGSADFVVSIATEQMVSRDHDLADLSLWHRGAVLVDELNRTTDWSTDGANPSSSAGLWATRDAARDGLGQAVGVAYDREIGRAHV